MTGKARLSLPGWEDSPAQKPADEAIDGIAAAGGFPLGNVGSFGPVGSFGRVGSVGGRSRLPST
ncbi:MAG: hypothetical protein F6J93_24800 [Oscillatoria sp. SIO1A7]|nr:hypothetical protein [Oscillatoria sp. SIO1A7]